METKTKNIDLGLISGIIFAVLALFGLATAVNYFSVLNLLWPIAYAATAAVLLMKRKDIITVGAFGLLALVKLVGFLMGFAGNSYSVVRWSYYSGSASMFSLLCFLPALVDLAAFLGIFAIVGLALTDYVPKYKELAKKLWFAPAALLLIAFVLSLFVIFYVGVISHASWYGSVTYVGGLQIFKRLLLIVGMLGAAVWAQFPNGLPELPKMQHSASSSFAPKPVSEGEVYIGLAVHVLLLLLTCGIWPLIWVYRITNYLNCVEDEQPRNPVASLLLYMFVPFYSIYWIYKSAQRIDKLAASKGIASDLAMLCLILAIFIPIIPPIIMQDKINAIVTGKSDLAPVQPKAAPVQPAPQDMLGAADELKKYKELLDSGVITQEEFDAKKKQLLGL